MSAMNAVKAFRMVVRPARRMTMMMGTSRPMTMKSGTEIKYSPVNPNLRRLQEHFQLDTGELVHLRGGKKDRVLYIFTVLLTIYGVGYVLYVVSKLAYPRPVKS